MQLRFENSMAVPFFETYTKIVLPFKQHSLSRAEQEDSYRTNCIVNRGEPSLPYNFHSPQSMSRLFQILGRRSTVTASLSGLENEKIASCVHFSCVYMNTTGPILLPDWIVKAWIVGTMLESAMFTACILFPEIHKSISSGPVD